MNYSRQNPSPRYRSLLAMYADMHAHGEKFLNIPAAETFDGRSLPLQAKRIKRLIERTSAAHVLDYGSGKGTQYSPRPITIKGEGSWDSVIDYWGVDEVTCFDPAYPPFSKLPEGKFDGVVSTDVLEHCPEEDVRWIIEEMFSFARHFVFATIACYPARKRLPSGENAHCTIQPPEWWEAIFDGASRHYGVPWEAWVQSEVPSEGQRKIVERCLGNGLQ
jgi:hypothetical protein